MKMAVDINEVGCLDRLAETIYTAVVSDVLDKVGVKGRVLDASVRPVLEGDKVMVGRATTASSAPVSEDPPEPYALLLRAIDNVQQGEILVIEARTRTESAIFGGLLATALECRGARGCVIDGAIRDAKDLHNLGFPTFATAYRPTDSFGRDEIVEIGQPVVCGGVEIRPGDVIVGDADGVVAVPSAIAPLVLTQALEKIEGEGSMRRDLSSGMAVSAAFEKYGIL